MLSVPNRATWEDYFAQTVIKNCDVFIYDMTNINMLDGSHLSSFSYTGHNSFACTETPSERLNFTIIDINRYETYKSKLSVGCVIKVGYRVENTTTTTQKIFYIKSVKYNHTTKGYDISAVSFLEALTSVPEITLRVFNANTGFFENKRLYDHLAEIKTQALDTLIGGIFTYSNAIETRLKQITFHDAHQRTALEMLQQMSLICAFGLKSKATNNYYYPYIEFIDFDFTSSNGNFNSDNFYDVWSYEDDEIVDPKNITHSLFVGGIVEYETYNFTDTHIPRHEIIDITSDRYSPTLYPTSDILEATITNKKADLKSNANSIQWGQVDFKGYDKLYDTPYQTLVVGDWGVRVDVANYLKNNLFYEGECRIDPTLEPLDIIDTVIDGEIRRIALEDVSFTFDGSFKGTLKGRALTTIASISVSGYQDEFITGNAFVFGGTVTATYTNGTTADVTASCTFSGYNMSGAGTQTVEVSYTEGGITKTTEYDISVYPKAPIVDNVSVYSATDMYFEVRNPNPYPVTLCIYCSSKHYTIYRSMSATTTNGFDTYYDQELQLYLEDCITAYNPPQETLSDDVYCWFEEEYSGEEEGSDSTIILEAQV